MADISLAELGHPGRHVRPDKSLVQQNFANPFRTKLVAHPREMRRNAPLIAQLNLATHGKVLGTVGLWPTATGARMTSEAPHCRHRVIDLAPRGHGLPQL